MKVDNVELVAIDVNGRIKIPKSIRDEYPENQYFKVVNEGGIIKLKPVSINISEEGELATMQVDES